MEITLQGTDILSAFDISDQQDICEKFNRIALKRGDVLVHQGRSAEAFYIVVTGRFTVTKTGFADAIAEIGPGQPIGEIAFLTGAKRTATVTALRDSVVLRLETETFNCLCREKPELWRALSKSLASRVANATSGQAEFIGSQPRTITLIPAGGDYYSEKFQQLLIQALESTGKLCVLTEENITQQLGHAIDSESTREIQALNNLETQYDTLLFVAGPTLNRWSKRAIRQADLVLSVARFNSNQTLNPLERFAADILPPEDRRLVLHHRRRRLFRGTANWLIKRKPCMHHHVALNNSEDFARLVRFIQGKAVGLVACGGGALCAAHVGVYKAFQERGILFDAVGGTSAGSAMVGAFALGTDPEEVNMVVEDIFIKNKAMHRYNWPKYGLLNHGNFDFQLSRYFAGYDIRDIWIPFFAVSTNLSRSALEIHRTGDLFDAIRASSSIPVLLPPVYNKSGEMLVDGCLLDNLPVAVMHDFKSGPNVVVNFSAPKQEKFDINYNEIPSGLALIRHLINPLKSPDSQNPPGVISVLLRSLAANRTDYTQCLKSDDMLLVPPIPEDAGILDWHRNRELNDLAYHWAREKLKMVNPRDHKWLHKLMKAQELVT